MSMISFQRSTRVQFTGMEETFLGYTIDWNYEKGYVDISIPEYVKNPLKHLLYKSLISLQYPPHEHAGVNWTNKGDRQYAQ